MGEHQSVANRVRLFMRRFGIDVVRYPQDLIEDRTARLIRHHRVSVVLDVGASRGRYAEELRDLGYRGRVVSFEPLSSSFAVLADRAARDPGWTAVRAAIADAPGTAELHVASNGDSSSILPMLPTHAGAAPSSRYVGTEDVPALRLDAAARPHFAEDDLALLKVDTQGYAKPVLVGADGILDRVVGIQVKLSLMPLYDGEMLFQEGIEMISRMGYSLMNVQPAFHEHESGRTLQAQVVFFREPPL